MFEIFRFLLRSAEGYSGPRAAVLHHQLPLLLRQHLQMQDPGNLTIKNHQLDTKLTLKQ